MFKNHLEFAAYESAQLDDTDWDRWIDKAEKIAGHDLDGNEASGRDNYSLDGALEAFEAGQTPEQYVRNFQAAE